MLDFGEDLLPDDDLASAGETQFELYGSYSISRPSPNAVSVLSELWNYTGSNHRQSGHHYPQFTVC